FGDVLKETTKATTAAFATLAGTFATLTRAASPALFNTLTQSMQLLAATVGQSLVGPVVTLSFKLQEMAQWVRALDPEIKGQIGSWLTWGSGICGAAFALSKITGIVVGLLPLFGALKTATVFTITSPALIPLAGGLAAAAAAMGAFGQVSDRTRGILAAV